MSKGGKMEDSEKAKWVVEKLKEIIGETKENLSVPKEIFQAAHLIKDITTDGKFVYFSMAFGPVVKKSIKNILGNQ